MKRDRGHDLTLNLLRYRFKASWAHRNANQASRAHRNADQARLPLGLVILLPFPPDYRYR